MEPIPVSVEPVMIGRDKGCDFHLPHQAVSRRHGLVRSVGGEVVYENKSNHGTMVNGRKVTFMCKLQPGDVLEIGPFRVEAQADPAAGEPAMEGTIPLDAAEIALTKKLRDALLVVKKLEADLEAKKQEVSESRRELESEVWRGFAVNRDLAEARGKVEGLQAQLDELQRQKEAP